MSVKTKILNFLSKKEGYNTLTTKQARARFGISNVAARINELRDEGHAIYTNRKTLADGRTISVYRLGTPSKKVIAAGIAALRKQGDRAFA
jgi:predicted ArsR family transcriptional regulator